MNLKNFNGNCGQWQRLLDTFRGIHLDAHANFLPNVWEKRTSRQVDKLRKTFGCMKPRSNLKTFQNDPTCIPYQWPLKTPLKTLLLGVKKCHPCLENNHFEIETQVMNIFFHTRCLTLVMQEAKESCVKNYVRCS